MCRSLPKPLIFPALFAAVIAVVPSWALGQSQSRQKALVKKLESPNAVVKAKEAQLIDEVLEPELLFPLDPSQSKVVRTKLPIERIAISDPTIAEVTEFSATEFEVLGLKAGETNLTIWFAADPNSGRSSQVAKQPGSGPGRNVKAMNVAQPEPSTTPAPQTLRYLVKVDSDQALRRRADEEFAKLESQINELFPNSQIQLLVVTDKLIVRGQARDAKEATEIMALLGGQGSQGIRPPLIDSQLAAAQNQVARIQGAFDQDRFSLVNLLHVPGEQQVVLKVRIAEITRSAGRNQGMDFKLMKDTFSLTNVVGGAGNIAAILNGGEVELFLKAFSTNGYSKLLAEPTLVTLSGQTATFISGGEFAVPTTVGIEGVGAVSTTFKGFGTQLSFTPTVIDKDRIRLQVSPTFSTLSGAVSSNIPQLNTRSVTTTVDLREGQWLAIAGLIQDDQTGSRGRVPYLGDIPGLGAAFGTQSKSRNESELVILVSPELVHPLEAEQVPALLPGMSVTEPTDEAFFFLQHIEGHPAVHHRSTVWPQYKQQVFADKWVQRHLQEKASAGYCETQQQYFFGGPHGLSQ